MRRFLVVLVLALAATGWPVAYGAQAAPAAIGTEVRADFDNDGFVDLAVGAPFEDVGSIVDAGAVNVLYGTATGLTGAGSQLFTEDSPDVRGAAEQEDGFGLVLAAGDFNGDGRADLAVGVPEEDVGSILNAGAVNVLYGRAGGLTGAGSQQFTQDSPDVRGAAEEVDGFGGALAAGDFNGDGRADLAVGTAGENGVGAFNVLYGTAAGLTGAGSQQFTQDSPGVLGVAEDGDAFGVALAAGNFNGDGRADLAVGAAFEDLGTIADAGAVSVLYGTAGGLTGAGSQLFTQDSPGVLGVAEELDLFGVALAAGNFNGDLRADLAVGAAFEDLGTIADAGAVTVLYGTAGGLTGTGSQLFTQDSPGVGDTAEEFDHFGSTALAAGDFNGDGRADLAVGVPEEDVDSIVDAGAVNVLYGTPTGLTGTGSQLFTQDSPGVGDTAEEGDLFGDALAAGDFNGDARADLAAGVAVEGVLSIPGAGAVNVLYGTPTGLTGTGSQLFTQDSPGVPGAAEAFDTFGNTLAAGDPGTLTDTPTSPAGPGSSQRRPGPTSTP